MPTFTYPKEQLECLLWNESNQDFEYLQHEFVQHTRWALIFAVTFRDKITEKFYVATYQIPATEQQDCDPWFGADEVECIEVEPYEVTVTRYRECQTNQNSESSTTVPSENSESGA